MRIWRRSKRAPLGTWLWAHPAFTPWGAPSCQGGTGSKRSPEEAPGFPRPVPSQGCLGSGCRERHRGGEGKTGVLQLCAHWVAGCNVFQTNRGNAKATATHLPPLTPPQPSLLPSIVASASSSHCRVRGVSVPVVLPLLSPRTAALLAPAEAGRSPAQGREGPVLMRR